jgi:enterochelin esterase-like enzyme/outer membrane protein assembly factor BamB
MHRRLEGIVVLVALGLAVAAGGIGAHADPGWPGFRGPNSDGAVPDAKLFDGKKSTLQLDWKRRLGSGYSAVAVGDGRVVTMFAEESSDILAAFETETGDVAWRYRVGEVHKGHDGSHDGPISTPLMAGGRVFGLSAWGRLFAVNATTGKEVWATHLVDDLGSTKPYYGFTTSPLMADGVLVVEIGAEEGKAIAGLDPDDGKLLWTVGDDKIEYHSPIVATLDGRRQVLAAGQNNIYGIDAKSGEVLWSYEHGGDERAMGGLAIVPVPAGEGRVFLMNKIDSSVMLSVTRKGDEYEISELWSGNGIKQSYVVPVYHDGYIYGMSNRIFVCLDAATGDIAWRSREPGDGFPTLVGDDLVIITKPGSLHVAKASPEGYKELARLDLFEEHSWSEVAYADGHLYARSMAQLARIHPGGEQAAARSATTAMTTAFDRFLAEAEASADKTAVVDAFLSRQDTFPIVEDTGVVHFVYRGEAEDVGIVGDMVGFRREDPMTRLDGTDLFYYTTQLEPDAAVTYGFIVDFDEPVADPNNPSEGKGLFGEVSWLAMPAWQEPDFLDEADASRQGRLESLEWESEARGGQKRTAEVYLPAGYDPDVDLRYPVIYVHNGKEALEDGRMKNALDHLSGTSVAPLIAVFVIPDEEDPRKDLNDMESYSEMVVNELVPAVDARFPTIDDPMARGVVGAGRGANIALYLAFKHPELFRRVGGQSATVGAEEFEEELARGASDQPLVIYLDWGTYHLRSPHEAWDLAVENRKLWTELREAGYRPAGGEVPEGYGWACWNGHTEKLLASLFPLID